MSLSQRVLGAVDLAIEFATLGEYGLEQVDTSTAVDASHCRRERSGHAAGREALAAVRRGRCDRRTEGLCRGALRHVAG